MSVSKVSAARITGRRGAHGTHGEVPLRGTLTDPGVQTPGAPARASGDGRGAPSGDRQDGRNRKPSSSYTGLDGRAYKSKGEAQVADWLFLNGVPYRYEEPYPVDTRDPDYRKQYRPDFHIQGTGVYIEYWGVDRRGRVDPRWKSRRGLDPSVEYREGMEWKRGVHRDNGTELVELYSWQRQDGTLERSLRRQLRRRGVKRAPWVQRMRMRRAMRPRMMQRRD